MDREDEVISREIKRIAGGGEGRLLSGVVQSVNAGALTCAVVLSAHAADSETDDVYLNAKLDNNGLVLFPAVGSVVWVAEIDGAGQWGVVRCSELTKMAVKIGNSTMKVTAAGLTFERGGVSLKSLLTDVLNHIMALTVSTATGPSSVPVNVADFASDLNHVSTIFE